MNLNLYYLGSTVLFLSQMAYTMKNYELYSGVTYLFATNSSKLILMNFALCMNYLAVSNLVFFLLGNVREIEKLYVIDKVKRKIMELAFLLILFGQEQLDFYFFTKLIFLLMIISVHQISIKRSEYFLIKIKIQIDKDLIKQKLNFNLQKLWSKQNFYLLKTQIQINLIQIILDNQQNILKHLKLISLFLILFVIDYYQSVSPIINQNIYTEMNPHILIVFEVLIIFVKTLNPFIKYIFNFFEQITLSNFQQKQVFFTVIDFFSGVTKIIVQILIIHYVCNKYGLPIHLMGDLIDNFYNLFKTVKNFYNAINLFIKINKMENITDYEDICLICLYEIEVGKKIDCGHVYHESCLRSWIQANQNQFCPKCKAVIKIGEIKQDQSKQENSTKQKFDQDQLYIESIKQKTQIINMDLIDLNNLEQPVGSISYGLPQQAVQSRTQITENIRYNIMLRQLLNINAANYPNIFSIDEEVQNDKGLNNYFEQQKNQKNQTMEKLMEKNRENRYDLIKEKIQQLNSQFQNYNNVIKEQDKKENNIIQQDDQNQQQFKNINVQIDQDIKEAQSVNVQQQQNLNASQEQKPLTEQEKKRLLYLNAIQRRQSNQEEKQ